MKNSEKEKEKREVKTVYLLYSSTMLNSFFSKKEIKCNIKKKLNIKY